MKNSKNEGINGFGTLIQNLRRTSKPNMDFVWKKVTKMECFIGSTGTSEPSVVIPLGLVATTRRIKKGLAQSNNPDKVEDSPTEQIEGTTAFSVISPSTEFPSRIDQNKTEVTKTMDHLFPNVIIKDQGSPSCKGDVFS